MISFFSRPYIPLRFTYLNPIFSVPIVGFVKFLHTSSPSVIFQNIGRRIFLGEILAKKCSIFRFFRGYILSPVFTVKLRNANIFASFDGTPFSLAACCDSFSENFISVSIPQKRLKFLIFFLKQIRHSPLPTAFLNFDAHLLQTFLQDPLLDA